MTQLVSLPSVLTVSVQSAAWEHGKGAAALYRASPALQSVTDWRYFLVCSRQQLSHVQGVALPHIVL